MFLVPLCKVQCYFKVGQYTEHFDVSEDEMVSDDPRFRFIQAEVTRWDYKKKVTEGLACFTSLFP